MGTVTIEDITYGHDEKRAWNGFTIKVNGSASEEARIIWFEKSSRAYAGVVENANEWVELFAKFADSSDKNNLFKDAKDALEESESATEAVEFDFGITDKPEIIIANGSRELQIFIEVDFSNEEKYYVVCRQSIVISEEGTIEKQEFMTSNFSRSYKEEDINLTNATDVEQIAEYYGLGALEKA